MVSIICPQCQFKKRTEIIELNCMGRVNVRGIIQCDVCKHEFPFSLHGGTMGTYIQKLDTSLPGAQSHKLIPSVPPDIKDDVQEAERANYAQCYKACVTMCRRALQLSLIDKGIADQPLGKMLEEAKDIRHMLSDSAYGLAKSIKLFGDIGAHRNELMDPEKATLTIYATVEMLNELFR